MSEYTNALRAIAAWYDAHPEVPVPTYPAMSHGHLDTKEEAATLIRAFGSCKKNVDSGEYMTIAKEFGPINLQFVFTRSNVCVRKVVGVETIQAKFVEAHTVPAETKEIVEWECEPILAPAEEAA